MSNAVVLGLYPTNVLWFTTICLPTATPPPPPSFVYLDTILVCAKQYFMKVLFGICFVL